MFKEEATFVVCMDFTGDKVDEFELLELFEKRFIKEFDSLLGFVFDPVTEAIKNTSLLVDKTKYFYNFNELFLTFINGRNR